MSASRSCKAMGFCVLALLAGCASESDAPYGEGTAGTGGVAGMGGTSSLGGNGGAATAGWGGSGAPCALEGDAGAAPDVSIALSSATPRSLLWSVGYWTWAPSFGDPVEGTEELLAPLKPQLIRIGGYNPDANLPDPFDQNELDDAAAYAEATGAELLLQLPLLAMPNGERPTPQDAADVVSYANATMGHDIKYVSIGNEPDLYPDQGGLTDPRSPAIAEYTPERYCAEIRPMVEAVLDVGPTVQIVGPDLGYKYQPGFDWLTRTLRGCGDLFDVVAVHRYPFESLIATPDAARADMAAYRATIAHVRATMSSTGLGEKPLAVTEGELAYVASPTGNPNGSILSTTPHALWVADYFGVSAELGLWASDIYVLSGPDEYIPGLIGLPPERPLRPAYHSIALAVTPAGATRYSATSVSSDLRVYASRNREDDSLHVALVHWGTAGRTTTIRVERSGNAVTGVTLSVPAQSVTSLTIPDQGSPEAMTYGDIQINARGLPVTLEVQCSR